MKVLGCWIAGSVILFIVFLVLKLTGNMACGWAWVLSPIWIGIPVAAAAVVIGLHLLAKSISEGR